jgi:hypothetical protein
MEAGAHLIHANLGRQRRLRRDVIPARIRGSAAMSMLEFPQEFSRETQV